MAFPAEPQLASALWSSLQASELRSASYSSAKPKTLITGCRSIDASLDGGFEYGTINCLTGEPDGGAQQVSQSLLVQHLLSSSNATATVVDTALSLDLRKLHQSLSTQIQTQDDRSQAAVKVLDRLRIMKVFDFIGLTESMSELRDRLEGNSSSNNSPSPDKVAPKGTIGDSEDEDEMLDSEGPSANPMTKLADAVLHNAPHPDLLIIDNIAQCAVPLLKNNSAQGQALISSLMRSLTHLTKTHNLCTILLNGVTSYQKSKEESLSIFTSCTIQPALGVSLTQMLDLHLLVHQIPKNADDAEAIYGNDKSAGAKVVYVVEVVQDRYSHRCGRWVSFVADEVGILKEMD